jgi:hypothetical protein
MSIEQPQGQDRRRPRRQRYAPLLIPLNDGFEMIGVGRTKGYELVSAGLLPTVMVGARRYVQREVLEGIAAKGVAPRADLTPADGTA